MRLGVLSRLLEPCVVAPPVREEQHRADWVSGASMIVLRRSVFDEIGLLDEGYFLYFEETDFCLRARRAGWKCWYVPDSRVVHLVGQSSGLKDDAPVRGPMPRYWFASRSRCTSRKTTGDFIAGWRTRHGRRPLRVLGVSDAACSESPTSIHPACSEISVGSAVRGDT